jgi:hypothetical protein
MTRLINERVWKTVKQTKVVFDEVEDDQQNDVE